MRVDVQKEKYGKGGESDLPSVINEKVLSAFGGGGKTQIGTLRRG